MSRKLKVDLDEIVEAMEFSDMEMNHWFLDTQTGKVLLVSDETWSELEGGSDEDDELDDDFEDSTESEEDASPEEIPQWEREERELAQTILNDDENRYVEIEQFSPRDGYQLMEQYIATLRDAPLKEKLYRAISGRGAFRYFKDVLADHPPLLDQWFAFEHEQQLRAAREWLEGLDIEPIA